MQLLPRLAFVLCTATVFGIRCEGQLARWIFDNASYAPSGVDPNAVAGNASIVGINSASGCSGIFLLGESTSSGSCGDESNCSTLGYSLGGSDWPTGSVSSSNDYLEVSIGPSGAYTIDLTAIEIDERRSGSGPGAWEVRSSLDNYATSVGGYSIPDNTSWRCDQSLPLGASFSGLASTITFRIYGYNAEASGGTWRIDDVEIYGDVILSVTWLDFKAVSSSETVALEWVTAAERNSSHFIVQRSANGISFEDIGQISAVGNSTTLSAYAFEDDSPLVGMSYYRLEQVDASGHSSSSRMVSVERKMSSLQVVPNPATTHIMLYTPLFNTESEVSLRIVNILGETVDQRTFNPGVPEPLSIENLSIGTYSIQVSDGRRVQATRLMILH